MVSTAKLNPAVFFATCAQAVKLTVEQTYRELAPEDYAILQAIKESLPAANSESPLAILEFVRDAVRAHTATPIESAYAENPIADAPKS
jgi:hypothetical protein